MNYEQLLRRIRGHAALFGDMGEAKEKQAERIRDKCIEKMRPTWRKHNEEMRAKQSERMLRMWA